MRKQKKRKKPQGKKHRFRPGTVCLREIRKFQKASNCLTFAKFPFERLVRKLVKDGTKISKDVFTVLQYYCEQFMIDFLRDANLSAIHAGRVKLMASDLSLVNTIRKYPKLDTSPYKQENNEKTHDTPEKEQETAEST